MYPQTKNDNLNGHFENLKYGKNHFFEKCYVIKAPGPCFEGYVMKCCQMVELKSKMPTLIIFIKDFLFIS